MYDVERHLILTVLGFDLAWFARSSERLFVFGLHGAVYSWLKCLWLTSFSLPFSELSLVGLAFNVVD